EFDLTGVITSDGLYELALAPGAVSDIHGGLSLGFARSFTLDTVGPTVTATSVAEADLVNAGPFTFTATFDEDIDLSSLDPSDFELLSSQTGETIGALGFGYDSVVHQLTIDFPDLHDGAFALTLISGPQGIHDLVGNG